MNTNRLREIVLWVAQLALAALFLMSGGSKLSMPAEQLAEMITLPLRFVQFIGVCEVLGGLAMVLPGILRRFRALTPVAAVGLVIIMSGGVALSLEQLGAVAALLPGVAGVVAALVAFGRRGWLSEARTAQRPRSASARRSAALAGV